MSDFDWFSLMRGITEMHVNSLGARDLAVPAENRVLRETNLETRVVNSLSPNVLGLPGSVSGNEGVGGVPDFRQREHVAPSVSDRCVADSQNSTPLYLVASEIVDLVELERKNR